MDFMLGLVLSLTDNATAGINNAVNTLNQLTQVAENASNSLNRMASLSALSVVSNQLGNSFLKVGNGILGMFQTVLNETKRIGGEFENFDVTLTSLFGGAEEGANKSKEALGRLFEFAKKSPLEVGDVKDMIVTLQSQGINAFDMTTGAISGTRQEFLAFLTDLKSFKPEVANERFKMAIQNYIGSGEKKMMRTVFDMGDIEQIIGHSVSKTAEGRMNDIVEMVEKKGLTGLSEAMAETWTGIASNISDAFTQIYYSIASNGVFEKLKSSFSEVAKSIIDLDNKQLQAIGETIAGGLNLIVTPLTKITKMLAKFIDTVITLCETRPELVKLGMVVVAIIGSLFMLAGVALKVASALSGVSLLLLTMRTSFKGIGSLMREGALKMLDVLVPLTATLALIALAWKSDFAGIRTNVNKFVDNLTTSFRVAKDSVDGSVSNMIITLSRLRSRDSFFSNLTIGIMKLIGTLSILKEAWNDNTLSAESYDKMVALGIKPLVEAILDLKYRFGLFKDGFVAGWKEIMSSMQQSVEGFTSSVKGTFLESIIDNLSIMLEKLANNDPQAWYKLGESFAKFVAKAGLFFATFKTISGVVGIVMKLIGIFGTISGVISKAIDVVLKLKGGFITILGVIGGAIQSIIGAFGITTGILGAIAALPPALVGAIALAIVALVALIIKYREEILNFFIGVGKSIGEFFSNAIEKFGDFFSRVGEYFKDRVTDTANGVKNIINTIIDFFGEAFTKIKNIFSKIGSAVADAITKVVTNAINRVLSRAVSLINGFISAINAAIGVINALPGVSIKKISKLAVPKMAMGGIVDKPTMSIIGEAGSEAVVPLENNTGWISKLASMISTQIGGNDIVPSNTSNVSNTNNSNSSEYITRTTNNNSTVQGDTDNSIVFEEGSIQITVQNASEEEAIRLAKKIMEYIKRQRELDRMLSYS